jgi:ATP-binding cassette, subfamily C (CFTR/MRP), member 1
MFIFWLLLVVLAIPQLRFEINHVSSLTPWKEFQFINYVTYFVLITTMLLLNCWSDNAPRNTTYAKSSNPSPQLSSSFVNQIFFQWFDRTAWAGWRHPLTEKDIYDINPEDTSAELVPPFDKYFNESVEKGRR